MFDPEHAKLMELMKAAMDSPEPESEVIGPDGTGLRVIKHPEPGVRMRMVPVGEGGEGLVITMWEAAPDRPQGYPKDLPFIQNVAASVTVVADKGSITVNWWGVEDATDVVEQLVSDSVAGGWERTSSPELPKVIPVQLVTLQRGARVRVIMAASMSGGGMVTLIEQQSEDLGEAV